VVHSHSFAEHLAADHLVEPSETLLRSAAWEWLPRGAWYSVQAYRESRLGGRLLDSTATLDHNPPLAWDSTEAVDVEMNVRMGVLPAGARAGDSQAIVQGFGPRNFVACLTDVTPRNVGRDEAQGAPTRRRIRGCCTREIASLKRVCSAEGEG
jgi:hypothetical protein